MPLFSEVLAETIFRFGRIQQNSDWFWPGLFTLLGVVYVLRHYRKDAASLRFWQRGLLILLRVGVVLALLLFYLDPQWERLVGSSRVVLLLDGSASMASRDVLPAAASPDDAPAAGAENKALPQTEFGPSRWDAAVDWLERSELIPELQQRHDVVIYRFDRRLERLLAFEKTESTRLNPATGKESAESLALLESQQVDGSETRLGEMLLETIRRERGEPLSAVVLLSDGAQNAGVSVEEALGAARQGMLPVHTIGLGATRQPFDFRAASIDVAERVYPNDPFTVRVHVELLGGATGDAEEEWKIPLGLWLKPVGREVNAAETKVGEKTVVLPAGSAVPVDFEIRSEQVGRYEIVARLETPPEDVHHDNDTTGAGFEIVDRKDRVLLYAGGPGRDYRFLVSQLHRDPNVVLDLYMPWTHSQGSQAPISQSADTILRHFPKDSKEMAKYDCLLAFDPDWSELTKEEIDALEFWVARQGGGLAVVAGGVHMADSVTGWTTDSVLGKIRGLYPVELFPKTAAVGQQYHALPHPMALHFTRAGEEAEFLRPVDDPAGSRGFWAEFPGFYAFTSVKGIKPTATLLASIDAKALGVDGEAPIFVEQFYGSGRVFYIGSAELWRLRRFDPAYFEKLSTKIVRHLTQGRLSRQSDRGTLTAEKRNYALGAVATLRATADDIHLEPLLRPNLPLDVTSPQGKHRTLSMLPDPNLPGAYIVHLPLTEEGSWSLALTLPDDAGGGETIVQSIQVRMTDLERSNPSRNESLLTMLAEKSGGRYYASPGLAAAARRESGLYGPLFMHERDKPGVQSTVPALSEVLKVRSQRAVLDPGARERIAFWLLAMLCALLLTEWTLRRFWRLA